MTADRELLELAAEAAGLPYIKPNHDYSGVYGLQAGSKNPMQCRSWNPISDDGDAFRLAVKLGITAGYSENLPPEVGLPREAGVAVHKGQWFAEVNQLDPCAATRRAIVRAAAEIGRKMKAGE